MDKKEKKYWLNKARLYEKKAKAARGQAKQYTEKLVGHGGTHNIPGKRKHSDEAKFKDRVMTTKEYNDMQYAKYEEDMRKWRSDRSGSGGTIPQYALYFFPTTGGRGLRKTGYVGLTEHGAVWSKTRKGAIEKLKKR